MVSFALFAGALRNDTVGRVLSTVTTRRTWVRLPALSSTSQVRMCVPSDTSALFTRTDHGLLSLSTTTG